VRILPRSHCAFGLIAAATVLSGCGGSQPPIGAPGAMAQERLVQPHQRSGSDDDLLYLSEVDPPQVNILAYPSGTYQATISGAFGPICTSPTTGNVYIDEEFKIEEFSPGATTPMATADLPSNVLGYGCSVDPSSGDIAVAAYNIGSETSWFGIYKDLTSAPTTYFDSNFHAFAFCAYDTNGDVFVDGQNTLDPSNTIVDELPKGAKSFTEYDLGEDVGNGPVQWEGRYITVEQQIRNPAISRIAFSESTADIVGVTRLGHRRGRYAVNSWIQGATALAPWGSSRHNDVLGFWNYPVGGKKPKTTITGLGYVQYVAVSAPSTKSKDRR
jgi:hypothetical protein